MTPYLRQKRLTGTRHHVSLDLQPYTCLDATCKGSITPFATRTEWSTHLALDHAMSPEWKSIKCPLCAENTRNGCIAITNHLAKHLEEISLSAVPIGVGSDDKTETDDADRPGGSRRSDIPLPLRPPRSGLIRKAKKTVVIHTCDRCRPSKVRKTPHRAPFPPFSGILFLF